MSDSEIPSESCSYLVNGLPSLLARRVLEQVLCFEPRARVFSVVHADDIDFVQKTLAELEPAQRARVELLTGDVTRIDFGLSGQEYLELTKRVGRVHHVISQSSVYIDSANQESVGAALGREIVEFGRAAAMLRSFVVYSSATVSGNRTGTVLESELVHGQAFVHPYDQALALMEFVAQRAAGEFPMVIVRPTMLAADSQTGECERTTPLYRLVDAILALPEANVVRVIRDRSPLHLVAIDYVARAAYYVGRRPDTIGATLHLADRHPTTVEHLLDLLLDAAGHRRRESAAFARMQQPASEWMRAVQALKGPGVFYDTRRMDQLISKSGIACPSFQDYADKVVAFVRGRRG